MELDIDHLPAKYWDQSKGVAIGPYRDKNLVFNNAISKAIDIEVRYKLSGQVLNLQKFKAEFLGNSIRGDFVIYMERAIKYRHSLDEIATSTMKQHLNVCKKMKQFFKQLSFGDITRENIQKFDLWNFETMSRNQHQRFNKSLCKNGLNTRGSNLKILKTYITRAIEDLHLGIPNPFTGSRKIRIFKEQAQKSFLEKSELMKLYKYYLRTDLRPSVRDSLRSFLLSCFCGGFRIADRGLLRYEDVVFEGGMAFLAFVPYKTARQKQKLVKVPLNDTAKALIGHKESGPMFQKRSESDINKTLKLCAALAGISKNVNFKTARDTFATQYLENGGRVEVLSEFLGHEDIRSTMVYVKITESRKQREINNMDQILKVA